jgi:hypothetical protein
MSMVPLHSVKLKPAVRRELDKKLANRTIPLKLLVEWLAARGVQVTRPMLRRYANFLGVRPVKPNRFLHVDRLLKDADRPAYEALISNPRTTSAVARAWFAARGYPPVSDCAIRNHKNRFLEKLDGVRHSARFAQNIVQIARENGQQAMSDGMLTRFEQVLLEQLVRLEEHDRLDAKELSEIGKCVAGAVGSRERFEDLRRAFEADKRKAADEAEKLARRGASGPAVVARMREILGIEPGDDNDGPPRAAA